MLHKLMDFNPLAILAAAALGEKDAPSEVKNSEGRADSSGQSGDSEAVDSQDADDDQTAMGKTTSNGLKNSVSGRDTEKVMAPQKLAWSPDTLLVPSHLEGVGGKKETFSLDDLVQDIKKKGLEVELQKMLDKSIMQELHPLDPTSNEDNIVEKPGLNNNLVSVKNALNLSPPSGQVESDSVDQKSTVIDHDSTADSVDQKDEEPIDSNSVPSEADSKDSTDAVSPETTQVPSVESVSLDHPYAQINGQSEEDDIDVCSDNSPLSEGTDNRPCNMSLDCNYLKAGIMEGVTASACDLYKMSSSTLGRSKLPSCSSSTSSPTGDIVSKPKLPSSEQGEQFTSIAPLTSLSTSATSPVRPAPKYGKFKIGMFASFSSSNLELEKYLRNKDVANNRKLNVGIPADSQLVNSTLNSPSAYPNVHPLLQSPSLDWDRSEAGSETQDDSSDARTPHRLSPDITTERVTEWSHPMYHDHDYCTKEVEPIPKIDDVNKLNGGKRKYTKRKNKLDTMNHEKIMKAKYLKKELLKQDSFMKTPSESDSCSADTSVIKTNPVGRPRKRQLEKYIEEEIDPETGTKMKITGKFQDQYVYYLSKSSRTTTRRRQTPHLNHLSDKIIVPAPKPGDIVVPHLTDADIETVRLKGRGALNLPDRPHMTNAPQPHIPPLVPSSLPSSCHSNESISDVDSHIVSTILSMENDNLSSPTTSQAPDITSTVGLNPNQPALTESLRMMSGDSSITSEHVLNYLLSVVKDDTLLGTGSSFDTISTSSLFPSISPDSIYSKAEHSADVHQSGLTAGDVPSSTAISHSSGQDTVKSVQSSNLFTNNVLSNSHISEPDNFSHKVQMDETVGLPDDLSFMSTSQGTTSSSSAHDQDSQSSLKSMFGSDLSSLGTPQLSSSVPRLTSIEKTLDYLGVKDGEIKLDSSVFNSKMDHDMDTSDALTPVSDGSSDDTPWIVTVTLYFNDVPAIMINSQPYIRLVDIHKQILPAKDTGILKKRCQLLKIPVLNCTEMQRYFLVQYGRAYNSKSTLIISKEQATNLVTYYATPQPRSGKLDEAPRRRPSSCGSEGSISTRSPSGNPAGRKRTSGKASRKASATSGLPGVEVPGLSQLSMTETSQDSESSAPHGKRTRHKKVNYLEMLKGEEKEKSSEAAILETIESVVKSGPECTVDGKHYGKMSRKKIKNSNCDKTNNSASKKNVQQNKKNKEKGPKLQKDLDLAVQKVKGAKGKGGNSVKQPSERNIEINSDVESEDSMDLSQSKKFKPLKLKVKSLLNFAGQRKVTSPSKRAGLFSRSNSSTSPSSDRPLRVLAVAHQAALSGTSGESHLPSQPADIHLDLFTKSSSACVRCETCCQFLSVPHFMRHHHVPMDSEWLASEAAHRILVPRNKENISEHEKLLWEEFHRLQEAIGGFGEADDESDSDDGGPEDDDYDDEEDDDEEDEVDDQSSLELSGASSSLLSIERSPTRAELQESGAYEPSSSHVFAGTSTAEAEEDSQEKPSPSKVSSRSVAQKLSNEALSRIGLVRRESSDSVFPNSYVSTGIHSTPTSSNVRTSSRKRKSKQLFSIENYYTPKKAPSDPADEESSSSASHGENSANIVGCTTAISPSSKSRNSS